MRHRAPQRRRLTGTVPTEARHPEPVHRHLRACDGFGRVVSEAARLDRWASPSPCTEWDARGVVEHVIGFHDHLLLRPLDAKPERPKDDVETRWTVTRDAIEKALSAPGAREDDEQRARLLPILTTDVLVHTWDLARAVGVDDTLDPELCRQAWDTVAPNEAMIRGSDMFGDAVPVREDAPLQDRLLGFLGRDPGWCAG